MVLCLNREDGANNKENVKIWVAFFEDMARSIDARFICLDLIFILF